MPSFSGPLLPGDSVDGLGHNLQTRVDKSAAGSGEALSWILVSLPACPVAGEEGWRSGSPEGVSMDCFV